MSSQFWFWTHFVLVTLSHLFVAVLAISTAKDFLRSKAPMLKKLRRLGVIFFLTVLGVNHLTNTNSKCIITTLENSARIIEGKEVVGDFLPRYYRVFGGEI